MDAKTKLVIEVNNSIDDLIMRLLNILENDQSPQTKVDMLQSAGVQLNSTVDFWNYKFEKLKNVI